MAIGHKFNKQGVKLSPHLLRPCKHVKICPNLFYLSINDYLTLSNLHIYTNSGRIISWFANFVWKHTFCIASHWARIRLIAFLIINAFKKRNTKCYIGMVKEYLLSFLSGFPFQTVTYYTFIIPSVDVCACWVQISATPNKRLLC